jgi:hypothetical protein
VDTFKDYFGLKSIEPVKKRHMHPIGRDPISHPQTPGKFVPDMWKTDNDVVPEFEALKKSPGGQKLINKKKAAKLRTKFPLKKDGKLGNTGISMVQNPGNPQTYILQK